jgi:hypothetical protein
MRVNLFLVSKVNEEEPLDLGLLDFDRLLGDLVDLGWLLGEEDEDGLVVGGVEVAGASGLEKLRVAGAGLTGVEAIGKGLDFTASGTLVCSAGVRSSTLTVPPPGFGLGGVSAPKKPKLLVSK